MSEESTSKPEHVSASKISRRVSELRKPTVFSQPVRRVVNRSTTKAKGLSMDDWRPEKGRARSRFREDERKEITGGSRGKPSRDQTGQWDAGNTAASRERSLRQETEEMIEERGASPTNRNLQEAPTTEEASPEEIKTFQSTQSAGYVGKSEDVRRPEDEHRFQKVPEEVLDAAELEARLEEAQLKRDQRGGAGRSLSGPLARIRQALRDRSHSKTD